jgi:hypothetical protein
MPPLVSLVLVVLVVVVLMVLVMLTALVWLVSSAVENTALSVQSSRLAIVRHCVPRVLLTLPKSCPRTTTLPTVLVTVIHHSGSRTCSLPHSFPLLLGATPCLPACLRRVMCGVIM